MNNWYATSCIIIDREYKRILAECIDPSPALILKEISRLHYPFGERAMWPYKQWCKAIRAYGLKVGVMPKRRKGPTASEQTIFI